MKRRRKPGEEEEGRGGSGSVAAAEETAAEDSAAIAGMVLAQAEAAGPPEVGGGNAGSGREASVGVDTLLKTDSPATVPVSAPTLPTAAWLGLAGLGGLALAGGSGGKGAPARPATDTTQPSVVITADKEVIGPGETAIVTFRFSEVPVGFSASDIVVNGGHLADLAVSADPRVYTATLTPGADTIVLALAASAYQDAAGNAGAADRTLELSHDAGSSGAGIDGYIADALVFRDSDGNGVWTHEHFTDADNDGLYAVGEIFVDANGDGKFTAEAAVKTDAAGNFSGLGGEGRIILVPLVAGNGTILSRDISTGAVFTKQLSAPSGSSIVSPLTTLVDALAGEAADQAAIAAAEAMVKTVLGIPDEVALSSYDPIKVAATSTDAAELSAAIETQKAASQVANLLAVVSSAATRSESFGSESQAAAVAASSLASQIEGAASSGDSFSLTSDELVQAVIGTVAASGHADGAGRLNAQAETLSQAVSVLNAVISSVSSTETDKALEALTQVAAVQVVAQISLVQAVEAALDSNTTMDATAFSGASLANKLDQAAAEVQIIAPNYVGTVSIGGSAVQGRTLSAALSDPDGIAGSVSLQWQASGVDIAGATGNTLVLGEALVGTIITVRARYTDSRGAVESLSSAVTAAVANINDPGRVSIGGNAVQGQTLTATVVDADGVPGSIAYQWQADGALIAGATGASLLLGEAQVGKSITVRASYTDGRGTTESHSSVASVSVANVNDPGAVSIAGAAVQGQTLTATVSDVDGLPANIGYQWRVDGLVIDGATASTFTPGQAQVGKTISLAASYTDLLDTFESIEVRMNGPVLQDVVIADGIAYTALPDLMDIFRIDADQVLSAEITGFEPGDRIEIRHAAAGINFSNDQFDDGMATLHVDADTVIHFTALPTDAFGSESTFNETFGAGTISHVVIG